MTNSLKQRQNYDESLRDNIEEWANHLEIQKAFQVKSVHGSCTIQYINCIIKGSIIIDVNGREYIIMRFISRENVTLWGLSVVLPEKWSICDSISLTFSTPIHLWPTISPVQLRFLPNRSDFSSSSSVPVHFEDRVFTTRRSWEMLKKIKRKESYYKPHFSNKNYHPKEELINI